MSISRVTTFMAVTTPHYARVGELHVDQTIKKLERQTPEKLPQE